MSFWDKLTGGFVEKVGDAIDKNVTSDEERLTLKKDMEKQVQDFVVVLEQTMTERWKADMASDSKLSKNIRPGMWLGTGVVLVLAWVGDTALRNWGLVGVSDQVLEGAFWGFATISGLYIPAREAGKGIINWKKK